MFLVYTFTLCMQYHFLSASLRVDKQLFYMDIFVRPPWGVNGYAEEGQGALGLPAAGLPLLYDEKGYRGEVKQCPDKRKGRLFREQNGSGRHDNQGCVRPLPADSIGRDG